MLKDEDADRPLQLTIVRELLSNTVLMPLLLFFIPEQANALLLWILTMGEEKKEGEEAPKAGDEAKVPKEGDIKWRAKQSEEFENATMRKQSGGSKKVSALLNMPSGDKPNLRLSSTRLALSHIGEPQSGKIVRV